ncbi:MAG: DUF6714 family protein [Pseudomonas sp.]|uniref:DUF6714 family protein n=1 Tax=Pseudomonas sp. TaxID=306 RepID=UPI003391A2F4
MTSTLTAELLLAFATEVSCPPLMSLRGGDALDDYGAAMPFDSQLDRICDEYLEAFHWGLGYLDAGSWRHYLPLLFQYAFSRIEQGSVVTSALLHSLSPPDRLPPRLGSLSYAQEAVVRQALEHLAFAEGAAHSEQACQVLEAWWLPNALYRPVAQ